MNVKSFIHLLKRKIDELEKLDIIHSKMGGKWEDLGCSEWTYLFNIALYLAVSEYKSKKKQKLHIVPEKGGKFPTDFSLETSDGKEVLFIEHENDPCRIEYNIKKLCKSKAKNRLLVCYEDRLKLKDRIKKLMKYKGKNIIILIGPYNIDKTSEYKIMFL